MTETFPAKHRISISSTACYWHTEDEMHATEASSTYVNSGYSLGPPPHPQNKKDCLKYNIEDVFASQGRCWFL